MQVKKFEASTMKEALEMVKTQLGPDAIILSAKGNTRNGLLGKNSVEVTAAVSQTTLNKKKFAESKLRDQDKKKFLAAPARQQRAFIEDVVTGYEKEQQEKIRPPITRTPYVDINDEEGNIPAGSVGKNVRTLLSKIIDNEFDIASDNPIDQMAARLKKAGQQAIQQSQNQNLDVQHLKEEISRLKGVIEGYRSDLPNKMSLHPGADWGVPFELSFMFERITQIGISEENAFELVQEAQKQMNKAQQKDKSLVEAWMFKYLLSNIKTANDPYRGRVHMFVGAGGQGKTSSLVKFATHLSVAKRATVAILTADNVKIGAADQLKILARILNVPFGVIRSGADWDHYLTVFKNVDFILVDFPGLSLKSPQELQLLQQYLPPKSVVRNIHYVQSAVCRDSEAIEMGKRYQALGFDDTIFTCVDEAVQHGIFYNFQKKFESPIHSLGIGSKMPEDYEIAIKERVLDLMFKITKQD
jgi:flagellar biosynthesis protein FlhF